MLMITNLRDGAVLDHRCGTETDEALEIQIEGIAPASGTVKVNGICADRCDRCFSAKIQLTKKINRIVAEAEDAYGEYSQTITVVWDKNSFKRYNFFIDDCSFFLYHIVKDRPASIFEEMFLGRLKNIHDKYGTKFTLNLFAHDDHHDFSISDFPADYKEEFKSASDWLKMSFHSKSEFPDRPYQSADMQTLADDFDLIYREVCRFAGEDSFIAPLVIHWAMTNPENFQVLKARNVNLLTGGFINSKTSIHEKDHSESVCDIGYYYEKDITCYIRDKHFFYDRRHDMFLMNNLLCCNYTDIAGIRQCFEKLRKNERDTISLMTHEQYSYPDYFNYIPDHLDRIEEACRLAAEAGYKPTFFALGTAGNLSW